MDQASAGIGHVHLKVSDLERSVAFYRDVLGMELQARFGTSAAFMSYGGYHHHLGLNTWHSKGGPPSPDGAAGLYHFAVLFPDRRTLARALKRVLDHGVGLDGAADHGVSEALYLHDPDDNGIEWPRDPAGNLAMFNAPLDVAALLAEA
jgi:catechol 2,3-dioxygenase